MVVRDESSRQERERAPGSLQVLALTWAIRRRCTYSSDALHAEHEGAVGREVSRVGQRILLPQLAEQVLVTPYCAEIVRIVSLEEEMDEAAEDKPKNDGEI